MEVVVLLRLEPCLFKVDVPVEIAAGVTDMTEVFEPCRLTAGVAELTLLELFICCLITDCTSL